jgi:hypothetical protein
MHVDVNGEIRFVTSEYREADFVSFFKICEFNGICLVLILIERQRLVRESGSATVCTSQSYS